MRAYRKLAASSYIAADRRGWQDRRTRTFLARHTAGDSIFFFVIAVPSMLHLLVPSIRLIESEVKIVFIINGLSRNERDLLHEAFPDAPVMQLPTLPGASWPHGTVLSVLLRNSPCDFGVIDHDFFLFNTAIFRQLDLAGAEFAACLTGWRNQATGLHFPGTHFLYLRVDPVRQLMREFSVDANIYKRLPNRVSSELAALGLSTENPPKEYQNFFDSFLLLSALAMRHGLKVRFLDAKQDDFVHVGSTSMGSQLTKPPLLQYANARFAQYLEDERVAKEYRSRGVASADDAARLRRFLEPETASQIDALVNRLDARLGARTTSSNKVED